MINGEGAAFELVRCANEEAWLAERLKGIGGSDVAALMGLSRYKTPYTLWCEKSGEVEQPDLSSKEAVQWGNILEPVVGAHYAEQHPERTVRRVNALCRSIARPWAQASLDYEIKDPELGWGVLEIKTAGLRSALDWADGVPLYYQTQVQHYLSVTGRPFADVAVLIGGQEYREYRLMRDEEDIAAIDAAVSAFWRSVQDGIAPEVGGNDAATLFERHPEATDELNNADAATESLITLWRTNEERAKRARAKADEYKARLMDAIGDAKGLRTNAGRVTWQRGVTKRLDSKRLQAEQPDVFKKYVREVPRNGGLRWYPSAKGDK